SSMISYDTPTTRNDPLSLHDALPIWGEVEVQPVVAVELLLEPAHELAAGVQPRHLVLVLVGHELEEVARHRLGQVGRARRANALDRKSTRLNSSHVKISYAVFCLK